MSNNEWLAQIFQPIFITKIFLLVMLFAFAVFTIVIARQIQVMNSVVTENQSSFILSILSVIIAIAAISLFIVSLVIL